MMKLDEKEIESLISKALDGSARAGKKLLKIASEYIDRGEQRPEILEEYCLKIADG